MREGFLTTNGALHMDVPRLQVLAIAAVLLAGFALAMHMLSPSLGTLKNAALTPRDTSQTLQLFDLSPMREQGPHALYIPSAAGVTGLTVGSRDVAIADLKGPSGFGFGSEAILTALPSTAAPTPTTLSIRLGEDHGRIGVSRVFLAPADVVRPIAKAQREWIWRNQIVSMTVAVLASFVFMLLIGVVSQNFAPGALAALAYLVLAQALARERDVSAFFAHMIDGAEYLLAIWVAFALTATLKDKQNARRFGKVPVALLGLSSAAVFVAQPGSIPLMLWAPAAIAAPLIVMGVVRTWRATADVGFSGVSFATMLLALAAAAFGLMRAADPSLFNEAFTLTTLHSLGAVPLLAWSAITLARHSFDAWRSSLVKLKAEFAAQSVELGRVGAMLQEEARRRMLFEERSRITRDMHDGIGGRLLSLLIRVRAGRLDIVEVEREVQESLNDLRLIVDSLDSAGESLGAALNAFRARAERQLAGAGMTLDWSEEVESLDGVSLDPQAMLDVFRILQESVSNAIGHSGADKVSIVIAREGETLSLHVADNGRGLNPEAGTGRGKGLKNMKTRAARLGAALRIGSNGHTGTSISMTLPLIRPNQSSGGSLSQPS